jgi:hypothetical protein
MTEPLETELRAAFAEQARQVPANASERLRQIDYQPRTRTLSPRLAIGTGAGLALAATAGIVVALVGLSSGAAPAFAGWTAKPTKPVTGETANALGECTSRLASSAGGSGVPTDGWQPVLTDTRGPFTSFVLQSGSATATCLTGPSFTTTQANNEQPGGAQQHIMSAGSTSAGGPPAVSVMGLGGPSSGPISQATQSQFTTSGGQPYTFVQGQVEADSTSVTLTLSDATNVQATAADGTFIAWWPGNADATTAQIVTPSGETTQQLNFTPVNSPQQPPATHQSSTTSSRGPHR